MKKLRGTTRSFYPTSFYFIVPDFFRHRQAGEVRGAQTTACVQAHRVRLRCLQGVTTQYIDEILQCADT